MNMGPLADAAGNLVILSNVCPYKVATGLNVVFSQHVQVSCVRSGQQVPPSIMSGLQPLGGEYAVVCYLSPSR